MKSLLESLNIALFESKTVKSTVKDFFNWYFDEPISVKFDEGRGAYTAQFSIGTVKFDLDCMNVSLKPSR